MAEQKGNPMETTSASSPSPPAPCSPPPPAALHAQSIGVDFGDRHPRQLAGGHRLRGRVALRPDQLQHPHLPEQHGAQGQRGRCHHRGAQRQQRFRRLYGVNSTAGTDEVLNSGTLFSRGGTPLTITVTNVPFAAYRLVVYDLATTAGFAQSITAGGVSFFTLSPDRLGRRLH